MGSHAGTEFCGRALSCNKSSPRPVSTVWSRQFLKAFPTKSPQSAAISEIWRAAKTGAARFLVELHWRPTTKPSIQNIALPIVSSSWAASNIDRYLKPRLIFRREKADRFGSLLLSSSIDPKPSCFAIARRHRCSLNDQSRVKYGCLKGRGWRAIAADNRGIFVRSS